jgi:[ribosomal protein S5]-alanine N-acetyltransferase
MKPFANGTQFAYSVTMTTALILPSIDTASLTLREIAHGDAAELASFVTQPRYQKYITHRLKNDSEVAAFVARHILAQADPRRRIYHLVAEEYMSGEVIGDAFTIIHGDGSHEIGWGVHPALWRMGFGTEMGEALLALNFERLNARKVWCKVMQPNTGSMKLAKRIGMKETQSNIRYPVERGRTEAVQLFQMQLDEYYDLPY